MKFWVVDAFTDKPFAGNPAAVFIVEYFPDDKLMQNIAAEMNLSETVFIKKTGGKQYHIRWFTPNSEAPLCGHATIAAMHILMQNGIETKSDTITLQSISGNLKAYYVDDLIVLDFPRYLTEKVKLSEALQDIVNSEPIYVGFSQNCFLMEFATSEAVVRLQPDLARLKLLDFRALIVTAKGDGEFVNYDFISRYFAPKVGIDEDPVCASAHCRLIPYWSEKLHKKKMIAYQPSKRGGVIICEDLVNRVLIAGKAVTVTKGELC